MIKKIKENIILHNNYFKISNNEVLFNDIYKGTHVLIENNKNSDGIAVLPVLKDGSIILIKNYRYAADYWLYQVPKGNNGTKFHSLKDTINCVKEVMDEEISYSSNYF